MATAKNTVEMEKVFEPVRALHMLALENTAKLVEMNLAFARRYADTALANAREMIELKDPAAVQAFLAKQPEAMKTFADETRADAEAALKMGMSYFEEAGKVVSSNAKAVSDTAKKAA